MLAVLVASCGPPPRPIDLAEAQRRLERGEWRGAVEDFDVIAARPGATPAEKVRAWIGAALACERLPDERGARARLERAVAAEVPGESEPAMYYLADRLRTEDRARALNLYYRAAAGAEKHRSGGFPYRAAMDRILQLSMTQ
jgi:hypothetical protein